MPSVYDRALFGSAPPPPNSVGVGITSGLAPPGAGQMPPPGAGQMPPPGAGAPGGQVQDVQGMAVTAGLQDAAQQLQNMYGELDQAEDIESVINTLRGDQKPMKARYDELAGMVGEEDAGQTPESVLAILQPMFEILETVQKNVPEGGIASAPMNTGGEEPVNFNEASSIQAPGSEEAMARIAMGEQPMGFNLGGMPEVNSYRALEPENPYEGSPYSNWLQGTGPNPNLAGRPQDNPDFNLAELPQNNVNSLASQIEVDGNQNTFPHLRSQEDPKNLTQSGFRFPDSVTPGVGGARQEEYLRRMGPFMGNDLPTDPAIIAGRNKALLQEYLTNPRSKEEIQKEQEAFFGDDVERDAKFQAYMALVKAGSTVGGSKGSLLQGVLEAAPEFAEDISKVAATKSAAERLSKEFAYETEQRETEAARTQNLNIMSQAIQEGVDNNLSNKEIEQRIGAAAVDQGISFEDAELKHVREEMNARRNMNADFAQLGTETWVKTDANGRIILGGVGGPISVRRTATGAQHHNDGELEPIPKGYFKADPGIISALTSRATAQGSLTPRSIVVKDSDSPLGIRESVGVMFNGSLAMRNPTWDSDDPNSLEYIPAPANAILGSIDEYVHVAEVDDVGRVFATILQGENTGQSVLMNFGGKETGVFAFSPAPAVYNAEGEYVSGDPMVEERPRSEIPFASRSADTVGDVQENISNSVAALYSLEDVLGMIPSATGPMATVRGFAGNNLAMFMPDHAAEWMTFAQGERGAEALGLLSRDIIKALTLSTRYPVTEQLIVSKMVEDAQQFFANPELGMVRLQELARGIQNRLETSRSLISDQPYTHTRPVPTGTENDPFNYSEQGHFDYLAIAAANGADLEDIRMSITPQEAREAGLDDSLIPEDAERFQLSVDKLNLQR